MISKNIENSGMMSETPEDPEDLKKEIERLRKELEALDDFRKRKRKVINNAKQNYRRYKKMKHEMIWIYNTIITKQIKKPKKKLKRIKELIENSRGFKIKHD